MAHQPKVFVSHSSTDKHIARLVAEDLRACECATWLAAPVETL
jgi:3-hydroxyisobutyrate dehydrogenase-like beta-hydroxyacid dehydrogenase